MFSGTKHLRHAAIVALVLILLSGATQARSGGITGPDAEGDTDVAKAGCTCHTSNEVTPDDSVTLILDHVPHFYAAGTTYELTIQLIGGPEIDTNSNSGGFSMLVTAGELGGDANLVQNGDDATSLTHTAAGAKVADRTWEITWTAPAAGTGDVTIWLSGNAVNGDGAPAVPDAWNRLSFTLAEGEDAGTTRTVFAGNGEVEPPAAEEGHVDLHHMGAAFRAHWLGLLGFGGVIAVIVFCGFFLRYGFSRHYEGRSNLLALRMKHLRRGDQV